MRDTLTLGAEPETLRDTLERFVVVLDRSLLLEPASVMDEGTAFLLHGMTGTGEGSFVPFSGQAF